MNQIKFYKTDSGSCPVQEFLESLAKVYARKIIWVLDIIRESDKIPAQYFKKLSNTDDIGEVRASHGNNSFRLLGFWYNDEFIVLTNGFSKKTQKTPKKEIALSEKRKINYLRRCDNG